jgi:hypothetical protein
MRPRKETKAMGNPAHGFLSNDARKKIGKAEIS